MAEFTIVDTDDYLVAAEPPVDHTGTVTLAVTYPDGTSYESPWNKGAPTFPAMPSGIATREILYSAPAGMKIRTDIDTARLIIRRLHDGALVYDSALPIVPGSRLDKNLPTSPEEGP